MKKTEFNFPIFIVLYLIGVGLNWWHFGIVLLIIAIIADLIVNPLYVEGENRF